MKTQDKETPYERFLRLQRARGVASPERGAAALLEGRVSTNIITDPVAREAAEAMLIDADPAWMMR